MHLFTGQNANEVWQKAWYELKEGKFSLIQDSRQGRTQELLHTTFAFSDPRQRWVVSRYPPINPAFAIAEVVWILNGRQDAAFLNFWNNQLPKYAGNDAKYHGAYGYRLRHHFGVDQLERAYQILKNKPDTRQAVLQIWDSTSDLPSDNGDAASADIPCNVLAMLKLRNGKLEWMQINRSNDLYLGVPYNFVQFTTIQEVMAGWLGVDLGEYHHISDSLHLYIEEVNARHMRNDGSVQARHNSDSLAMPKEISDAAFSDLNDRLNLLIQPELSKDSLFSVLERCTLPSGYRNLLLIMVVEAARRNRWTEIVNELTSRISNPVLVQLWEHWWDFRNRAPKTH